MTHSFVTATFTAPGIHNWIAAPTSRSYLAHEHRHLFCFNATVEVTHDDRQVEYHDLRDHILKWATDTYPLMRGDTFLFGGNSCEHLARSLWNYLGSKLGLPIHEVQVSEDGEFTSSLRNETANV